MKYIQDIKKRIIKQFDENLHSIYIYGSVLDSKNSKNKDLNILILLKENKFEELKKAGKFFNRWKKILKTTPLIFDLNYIKSSLDVFPIEFNDIKRKHKTIYGEDYFENLKIDNKNLRLQCEQEIKGNLVHLESTFMLNYNNHKNLLNVMLEGISSYAAVFRNLLLLLNKEIKSWEKNIINIADILDFDSSPFIELYEIKQNEKKLDKNEVLSIYQNFFKEASKLADSVDKLKV